jgi:hypothetical protein
MNIADLEGTIKTGDPQAIISYLYAQIMRVDAEKHPGPPGPPGMCGPPGRDAGELGAGAGISIWNTTENGKPFSYISLEGPRNTISTQPQLSSTPTPAELIKHVQRLTYIVEELKQALSAKRITY